MIGSLRGILLEKQPGHVLVEVAGIGYEVSVTVALHSQLPETGQEVLLYVIESTAMYGGGITLYGFLTLEEKEIYLLLREIPGTGSKKALDYLDKIAKSAPDFRRAILEGDTRALVSLFGFSKKTAEKMTVALKDRLAGLRISGKEKWSGVTQSTAWSDAAAALMQLGYRDAEIHQAIEQIPADQRSKMVTSELLKEALKYLSASAGVR